MKKITNQGTTFKEPLKTLGKPCFVAVHSKRSFVIWRLLSLDDVGPRWTSFRKASSSAITSIRGLINWYDVAQMEEGTVNCWKNKAYTATHFTQYNQELAPVVEHDDVSGNRVLSFNGSQWMDTRQLSPEVASHAGQLGLFNNGSVTLPFLSFPVLWACWCYSFYPFFRCSRK